MSRRMRRRISETAGSAWASSTCAQNGRARTAASRRIDFIMAPGATNRLLVCYIWIQYMLLRGNSGANLGAFCLLLGTLAAPAADHPIEPVTVCEALRDLPAHEGKPVALLGRFSFRRDGRTLNEESCAEKPPAGDAAPEPHSVRLVDDVKQGPKPPE